MNKFKDIIFRDITSLGSVTLFFLLGFFLFSFGKINLSVKVISGLIITLIISSTIRLIYFKDRPQKRSFNNFISKIYASSFPSVHTTLTFFLAFTLINYSDKMFFKFFVISLAALVSYSRIYLKKHDWKDVLGGIVLAMVVFFLVNGFYQ